MQRTMIAILLLMIIVISGCTSAPRYGARGGYGQKAPVIVPDNGSEIEGMASFYGKEFGGRKTANGEIFDPDGISAAHRNWPFNTMVEVTSMKTGKTVVVRINDRGPFTDCIIDLSWGAAKQIGMMQNTKVKVKVISTGAGK